MIKRVLTTAGGYTQEALRVTHVRFRGIVTQIDYHTGTEDNGIHTLMIESADKTYITSIDASKNPNLAIGDYVQVQYRRGLRTNAPDYLLARLGLLSTVEDSKYKPGIALICPEPKIKKLRREDVKKPWDKLSLSAATWRWTGGYPL